GVEESGFRLDAVPVRPQSNELERTGQQGPQRRSRVETEGVDLRWAEADAQASRAARLDRRRPPRISEGLARPLEPQLGGQGRGQQAGGGETEPHVHRCASTSSRRQVAAARVVSAASSTISTPTVSNSAVGPTSRRRAARPNTSPQTGIRASPPSCWAALNVRTRDEIRLATTAAKQVTAGTSRMVARLSGTDSQARVAGPASTARPAAYTASAAAA